MVLKLEQNANAYELIDTTLSEIVTLHKLLQFENDQTNTFLDWTDSSGNKRERKAGLISSQLLYIHEGMPLQPRKNIQETYTPQSASK